MQQVLMLNYLKFFQNFMSQLNPAWNNQQQEKNWNGKTIETPEEYLSLFNSGKSNDIYQSNVKYMNLKSDGSLDIESGIGFFDKTIHLDDRNADGKITASDRGAQFINDYDIDKNGEVTAEEYLALMMELDKNKDGVISFEERKQSQGNSGSNDSSRVQELIKNFQAIANSIDMRMRETERKELQETKLNNIISKIEECSEITGTEAREIAESIAKSGGGVSEVEFELQYRKTMNFVTDMGIFA